MKLCSESQAECYQYANETQYFHSFPSNPGKAIEVLFLNWYLDSMMDYMDVNKLNLQSARSEVLLVQDMTCRLAAWECI